MSKITKEEMAAIITGRKYPFRLSLQEKTIAKTSGLVVIYGVSDDLLEFEGVINELLVGAYDETITATITKDGQIIESMIKSSDCDKHSECFFFKSWLQCQKTFTVASKWYSDGSDYYRNVTASKLPVATFEIKNNEDTNNIFCHGIVIDLNEAKDILGKLQE